MAQDIKIETDAATWGALIVTNLLIDALVTHSPDLAVMIQRRLELKIHELDEIGMEAAAPYLEQVLRALHSSARALQRGKPAGSA